MRGAFVRPVSRRARTVSLPPLWTLRTRRRFSCRCPGPSQPAQRVASALHLVERAAVNHCDLIPAVQLRPFFNSAPRPPVHLPAFALRRPLICIPLWPSGPVSLLLGWQLSPQNIPSRVQQRVPVSGELPFSYKWTTPISLLRNSGRSSSSGYRLLTRLIPLSPMISPCGPKR